MMSYLQLFGGHQVKSNMKTGYVPKLAYFRTILVLMICFQLSSAWKSRWSSDRTWPASRGYRYFKDDRVWLFAVDERTPTIFLDEGGKLSGFEVDLVQAVCALANKRCETILTDLPECSITKRNINLGGRGLMAGWFDACPGFDNSLDRENVFDFTDAYLESNATFNVRPGNPSGFNPDEDDLSQFTFTHVSGVLTNAQCLNRLEKKFGKVIIAESPDESVELVKSGKADVLFSGRVDIPGLETLPQRVNCDQTGTAVMTKKGSPLVAWWNPAFRSFVSQGLFKKFCDEAVQKYPFAVTCLI